MIRIISDSSTMYTIAEGKSKGIDIAPLSVTINNKTYKENEDINTDEFIEIINQGHVPMSSQPAIGEVVDLYNKYPNDQIINITMADGLSGTYNSACSAKNMANNPENIDVINSKTLCGPHRYIVDLAVELVNEGKSKEEILEILSPIIETAQSYLIPNDFEYLVRGGRLSPLVGKIGSAIKLVPVMVTVDDGRRISKFTTKRTFAKGIEKIAEAFIELGVDNSYYIYICHACNEELANKAKDVILKNITDADIKINKLTPAFTTQGGPGCISVQLVKKYNSIK